MKNKNIFWIIKYLSLGAVNNIKYCSLFPKNKKRKEGIIAYKTTRTIKVNTYFPENWLNSDEATRLKQIGENLIENKITCKN
jgi:hypothetical protein